VLSLVNNYKYPKKHYTLWHLLLGDTALLQNVVRWGLDEMTHSSLF